MIEPFCNNKEALKEVLEDMYSKRQMSCNAIRKELHTTNRKVMNYLVEFNIPVRTRSEGARLVSKMTGRWVGDDNPSRKPEVLKRMIADRDIKGEKNSMYGKHHSKETKKKMRLKKIKSHTPLYKQIRNSTKSDQWSRDVLKRDEYTCQECNRRGGYLEAHHIVGFKELFKEFKIKSFEQAMETKELWSLNNGITLCQSCHKKTDNFGGRG